MPKREIIASDNWLRPVDKAPMRLDVLRAKHGIRYKTYLGDILVQNTHSKRPYVLGQPCDGTTGICVHALYILFCRRKGLNPSYLYWKAYHDSSDRGEYYSHSQQERFIAQARNEGIIEPKHWNREAFEGLLESLTEITFHSLREVLEGVDI